MGLRYIPLVSEVSGCCNDNVTHRLQSSPMQLNILIHLLFEMQYNTMMCKTSSYLSPRGWLGIKHQLITCSLTLPKSLNVSISCAFVFCRVRLGSLDPREIRGWWDHQDAGWVPLTSGCCLLPCLASWWVRGLIAGVGGWTVGLAGGWVDGCLANWLSRLIAECNVASFRYAVWMQLLIFYVITVDVYLTHLSVWWFCYKLWRNVLLECNIKR